MKMRTILAAAAVLCLAAGCIKEEQGIVDAPAGGENEIFADAPKIMAELSEPETRTCIEAAADATGKLPMLWEESDAVGVFFADGSSNAKYVNISGKNPNASFGAAEQVSGSEIAYVYYPYDAANNGKAATELSGNVPAEQAMDGSIHGDYKWGELRAKVDGGYKFKFHNIVSLVRFNIDATGTEMASETLKKVTLTVKRGDADVPVTGSFSFSATDGNYTCGTTSNMLTTTWNNSLSSVQSGFASVLPEIKEGDQLNFLIETDNYKATVTMTSKIDFASGAYYTFPLTLSKLSKLRIIGDFTAATYNVDGLPDINYIIDSTNPDGPHSDGTKQISAKIATDNWDFVAFSEDFNYHTELMSSMTGYTFQEYDNEKLPTKYSLGITSKHWATDGLSFAVRNTTTSSFKQLAKVEFTSQAGGLSSGANTCVDKGFRHFLITMKDSTKIDVIITHMNTYSSSGSDHINAQHAQLKQIAQYINSIRTNKRPVVFMGDTNCRYTRHDFQTNFWSVLDSNLVVKDPWVEYQWAGKYPEYPSKSLMVSDATGTNSDTDIICPDTQSGEVVDKIIYINNPDAACQIKALNYLRDYDNYNGLADHMPIVVDFSYSRKINLN